MIRQQFCAYLKGMILKKENMEENLLPFLKIKLNRRFQIFWYAEGFDSG